MTTIDPNFLTNLPLDRMAISIDFEIEGYTVKLERWRDLKTEFKLSIGDGFNVSEQTFVGK